MHTQTMLPYLIFIGFALYIAFGVTVFIIFKILNKYNNFGDSSCDIDEYSRKGIHYMRNLDGVPKNEAGFLFSNFGNNPYEGRDHRIPEQLLKNAPQAESPEDITI